MYYIFAIISCDGQSKNLYSYTYHKFHHHRHHEEGQRMHQPKCTDKTQKVDDSQKIYGIIIVISPLDGNQCPHRGDGNKFLLVRQ